jgi:hypothetical protein
MPINPQYLQINSMQEQMEGMIAEVEEKESDDAQQALLDKLKKAHKALGEMLLDTPMTKDEVIFDNDVLDNYIDDNSQFFDDLDDGFLDDDDWWK